MGKQSAGKGRRDNGLTDFVDGPARVGPNQRHTALLHEGDTLSVFFTNAGDCPERSVVSRIELAEDWRAWRPLPPLVVLEPECDYEGADLPLEASQPGTSTTRYGPSVDTG